MRIGFAYSAAAGMAGAALLYVLSLLQATAVGDEARTFANATEQRVEMIRLLREQNALLREQLELLRSGKLHVVVEPAK